MVCGCFVPVKNVAIIICFLNLTLHLPSTVQEESSSDITSLFPHLDMEPLTTSERYGKKFPDKTP